jgi:hypothetical protein
MVIYLMLSDSILLHNYFDNPFYKGNYIMKKTVKIKFDDIRTPKTVRDFQDNLAKYLLTFSGSGRLYVRDTLGLPIENIKSFSDIYRFTNDPWVCVSAEFDEKDFYQFMKRTNQTFSADGYWSDKNSNYTIYESDGVSSFLPSLKSPQWTSLDNQIYRELFVKMFGNFSGYRYERGTQAA